MQAPGAHRLRADKLVALGFLDDGLGLGNLHGPLLPGPLWVDHLVYPQEHLLHGHAPRTLELGKARVLGFRNLHGDVPVVQLAISI